jgi:hypothetical protein
VIGVSAVLLATGGGGGGGGAFTGPSGHDGAAPDPLMPSMRAAGGTAWSPALPGGAGCGAGPSGAPGGAAGGRAAAEEAQAGCDCWATPTRA